MKLHGVDLSTLPDEEVERKVQLTMMRTGATRNVQAIFVRKTCAAVSTQSNPQFETLKRKPVIEDNEPWKEAFCLCLAYLKRYHMQETLECIKLECENTPTSTGYTRGSEVDTVFNTIFKTAIKRNDETFDDKVKKFAKNLKVEKRKKKQKKSGLE